MTLGIYFDDAFPFNFFDWTIFLRVIALDLLKNTCHSHFPVNSWYNLMKHFIGFGPFFLCVKFCSYPLFLCEEICRSIAQSTWRSSFTNKPLSTNNHIWRGISIHWICLFYSFIHSFTCLTYFMNYNMYSCIQTPPVSSDWWTKNSTTVQGSR